MNILVTGGAGYVGSHACKALHQAGHRPVVVDNLIYGHEWAVKWGPLHVFDLRETDRLLQVIRDERIEGVLHFAAFAYVGESVRDPAKYYENNVATGLSLLKALRDGGVQNIVFSSTCATYGVYTEPIEESFKQAPINPYGRSKLMFENILADYSHAYGLRAMALRYFNAAGADPDGEIGEDHDPETHLIPLAIAASLGHGEGLSIFGDDYSTPDGTCVRDYIHVTDLADAHVKALEFLSRESGKAGAFHALNLGTGRGASVLEVLEAVGKATNQKVPFRKAARREGDPAFLVANPKRARELLNWRHRFELEETVATAARWAMGRERET